MLQSKSIISAINRIGCMWQHKVVGIHRTQHLPIRITTFSTISKPDSTELKDQYKQMADGLLGGDRVCLARLITLIESQRVDHQKQAELVTEYIASRRVTRPQYLNTNHSLRLGIAGPPGMITLHYLQHAVKRAGKSTFIENLGMKLIKKKNRVAVIPVDPSSHISGGSILGDKTRMDQLSRSDDCYVRASPTRGVLGGIAEHTADVITLCEAAGYNVVIVESVGLGQSEVEIDNAVDMLVMIVPPGGGDGLQASKKGIMEAADLVVVNKADGALLSTATHTKSDYASAMLFVRPKHDNWVAPVLLASAATDVGVDEVEKEINKFFTIMTKNYAKIIVDDNDNSLVEKRLKQMNYWMVSHLHRQVVALLETNKRSKQCMKDMQEELVCGKTTARAAARKILDEFVKIK